MSERKRIGVPILGLDTSTPDHSVTDGKCATLNNLRYTGSAWRNVQGFLQNSVPDSLKEKEVFYAHIVNGVPNYITKDTKEVTSTKIKYYGMRSQAQADTLSQNTDENAVPTADLGAITERPISSILAPFSTTYYLDAPLSVARTNPSSVKLFDKNLAELGKVAEFSNGRLSYYDEEMIDCRDGDLVLYYSNVLYAKLGEHLTETFYFVNKDISAEAGKNAVFVKRGDNYIYYGYISNADAETKSYAIYEQASGITIACVIYSLDNKVIRFKRTIEVENDSWFHNVYEEYAMFMCGFDGTIGYFTEISNEGNALPKFSYDNAGNKVFVYYDTSTGGEEKFNRKLSTDKIESDEEYLARYKSLPIDEQIWVFEVTACANYVTKEGGLCLTNLYSADFVDVEPMPYIPFFYADSALNITEDEIKTFATLSAWNNTGATLGTIGDLSEDFTLDHFGNMLIARDLQSRTTHYFVFSEGKYQLYGSAGATKVEFNVSIEQSIHSPKMTDVPMYYKAPNVSASDGSLDGRMFVGAAEPICPLNSLNSNNNLLITNSDNFFRGELALFVVARAKDGTEIYRTPPQIVRSETLLDSKGDVFVFIPEMEIERELLDNNDPDDNIYVSYHAADYFPYYYLVWDRKYMEHAFFLGSEEDNAYKRYNTWKGKYDRYEKHIQPLLNSIKAADLYKLKIDIEAEGQNVHDFVIYSTRLYPLFTIEGETLKTNKIDVLNELFYEMKVLNGNERTYTITYNDLENIETKTNKVYEPTQSGETSFFATKGMEYNNCYHSFDIEVPKPALNSGTMIGSPNAVITDMILSRLYDNATYYAHYNAKEVFSNEVRHFEGFAPEQSYMLSFPLSVREVLFGKMADGEIETYGKFTPEYSYSLNCSYLLNKEEDTYDSDVAGFVRPNRDWTPSSYSEFVNAMQKASRTSGKYKQIALQNLDAPELVDTVLPQYPIRVSNRIQVSEANNPLVNPYENSYRIGSLTNEIIAVNSGAIEMSDSKFGEFPVYVFTKEGIFAMQSGKDTLYSAIIPINYDVIINPNTIAVNGAVLYFTDKGLHALTNQGAKLLSAPIHTEENRIPDWMYTCQMVYMPEWNEVLCTDLPNKKAYVFSLDNNVWSTRDIPEGYILNNDELVGVDATIYNLRNEAEESAVPMPFTLTTRPIKLGSMELKRAETIIVRFECKEEQNLMVKVEGSIDTQNWGVLRDIQTSTNKDVVIRRTPCSVKYLRFTISGTATKDIRILAFELEYYNRMRHRMR